MSSPPIGRLRRAALPGLALLVALAACGADEPAPATTAPQAAAVAAPFVTTAPIEARCAECHADIAESYARSAMARAFGVPSSQELAALTSLPPAESASGFHYGLFGTPDGSSFVLGETQANNPDHRFGAEIERAIGAGVRDRSFAVRHGVGLYFAPAEVLTDRAGQGERYLALAPGESIRPGMRFGQPITDECLACHTSAPVPARYPMHHINPKLLPETGIGCAGCHGTETTLDDHITHQADSLAGGPGLGTDPLLELGALDRNARMSICAACHLQGDARVVLSNQSLGRHVIGADLTAERATFVARQATTDVGFVSQTERLVLSACYLASDMDCTTCHDPHQPLQANTAALTRAQELTRRACLDCHAIESCVRPADTPLPSHALGDEALDCVTCHMPLTNTFDVADVTIHDHFVRRAREAGVRVVEPGPLRFPESPTGDWKRFRFPGQPEPATAPGLRMMALTAIGLRTQAATLVDAPPGPDAQGLAMYHHVRATLLEGQGRTDEAQAAYERALELDPELGVATTNLGLLLGQQGDPDAGIALLDALLERAPSAEGALRNRALLQRQRGNYAAFRSDLERAFSLAPSGALARTLSASYAAAEPTPDPQRASRYAQLADQLDPR